ncbi:MAG: hypothetical protein QM796_20570 [Chthoniobacteraceae bacterium]
MQDLTGARWWKGDLNLRQENKTSVGYLLLLYTPDPFEPLQELNLTLSLKADGSVEKVLKQVFLYAEDKELAESEAIPLYPHDDPIQAEEGLMLADTILSGIRDASKNRERSGFSLRVLTLGRLAFHPRAGTYCSSALGSYHHVVNFIRCAALRFAAWEQINLGRYFGAQLICSFRQQTLFNPPVTYYQSYSPAKPPSPYPRGTSQFLPYSRT